MAVKYVKDFAFDSGFGFSGSSGKTPVRSHMRSPMKKADGGVVKSKGFDNSTRNPISKFPDIAPAMVGKGPGKMGGKTSDVKPLSKAKASPQIAKYAKGGSVKKAHAKKQMPSFLKGKMMKKAEGGPVAEILPSDGMSPLQRMSGDIMPIPDEYDGLLPVEPPFDPMRGVSIGHQRLPVEFDRERMDDAHTRMTEMNRQLAQLLAEGNNSAGPPGMMAPVTGSAPKMDPGAIQRLTPRKEYGINLPSPDREYGINLPSPDREYGINLPSPDREYGINPPSPDREYGINPPSPDREYRQLPVESPNLAGGANWNISPLTPEQEADYWRQHLIRPPSGPPMLRDAGPGDDFGGYFQPGKGSVPSPLPVGSPGGRIGINPPPRDMDFDDRLYAGGPGGPLEPRPDLAGLGPPRGGRRVTSPLAEAGKSAARNMRQDRMTQARDIMDRYIAGPRRAMPTRRAMPVAPRAPMIQLPREPRGGIATFAKGGKVTKGERKIGKVMGEFKRGELHSGSKTGPKVTNPKQATAIALSEARAAGAKIPKKATGGEVKAAVHKHERSKHPGKPLTKLRKGGMPCG